MGHTGLDSLTNRYLARRSLRNRLTHGAQHCVTDAPFSDDVPHSEHAVFVLFVFRTGIRHHEVDGIVLILVACGSEPFSYCAAEGPDASSSSC
jgi:hypothetical protein